MDNSNSNFKNLSLTQTLFKSRLSDKKVHEKKDSNTIYVTDLLYCPLKPRLREQFKELTLAEAYNPSTLQGSLIHESIEGILTRELNAKTEVPIAKELTIGNEVYKLIGRADAILGDTVIEIKTSKNDTKIPVHEHETQLKIYMTLLGSTHGVLLYITPDRIAEFHYDEKLTDTELENLVKSFLRAEKVPRHNWECKYCAFSKVCPHKVSVNEDNNAS